MKKELYIHIPTPCHENWHNMTPTDKGRFCQSCAKQVVDFSTMTDQQVLNYFANATGPTCGRFSNEQLQRPLQPVKEEKRRAWWVAAMMPLMMLFEKAGAQQQQPATVIEDSTCRDTGFIQGDTILPIRLTKSFTGKVLNKKGEPLPCAFVTAVNNGDTITDSLGMFSLQVPVENDTIMLDVSAIGYEKQTLTIITDTTEHAIILEKLSAEEVSPNYSMTGIDYVVLHDSMFTTLGFTTSVMVEETFIEKVTKLFIAPVLKIFPNPAAKNSNISITVKEDGSYYLQLLNEAGAVILTKKIEAAVGTQLPFTLPPFLATGVYFIRLIDERKKKQYTQKLLVQ